MSNCRDEKYSQKNYVRWVEQKESFSIKIAKLTDQIDQAQSFIDHMLLSDFKKSQDECDVFQKDIDALEAQLEILELNAILPQLETELKEYLSSKESKEHSIDVYNTNDSKINRLTQQIEEYERNIARCAKEVTDFEGLRSKRRGELDVKKEELNDLEKVERERGRRIELEYSRRNNELAATVAVSAAVIGSEIVSNILHHDGHHHHHHHHKHYDQCVSHNSHPLLKSAIFDLTKEIQALDEKIQSSRNEQEKYKQLQKSALENHKEKIYSTKNRLNDLKNKFTIYSSNSDVVSLKEQLVKQKKAQEPFLIAASQKQQEINQRKQKIEQIKLEKIQCQNDQNALESKVFYMKIFKNPEDQLKQLINQIEMSLKQFEEAHLSQQSIETRIGIRHLKNWVFVLGSSENSERQIEGSSESKNEDNTTQIEGQVSINEKKKYQEKFRENYFQLCQVLWYLHEIARDNFQELLQQILQNVVLEKDKFFAYSDLARQFQFIMLDQSALMDLEEKDYKAAEQELKVALESVPTDLFGALQLKEAGRAALDVVREEYEKPGCDIKYCTEVLKTVTQLLPSATYSGWCSRQWRERCEALARADRTEDGFRKQRIAGVLMMVAGILIIGGLLAASVVCFGFAPLSIVGMAAGGVLFLTGLGFFKKGRTQSIAKALMSIVSNHALVDHGWQGSHSIAAQQPSNSLIEDRREVLIQPSAPVLS